MHHTTTDVATVNAGAPVQANDAEMEVSAGTGVSRAEAARMWTVAKMLANTKLVSKPLQGNPEAVMGVGLHLVALGLPFSLVGMKQVHVWEDRGTVVMQLHYQAHIALMARAGHDAWLAELTDEQATVNVIRADTRREQSFTYTMAMAARAGLTGKDNWQKHPHYMLPARAAVMACRFACPDALIGLSESGATNVRPIRPDQIPAAPATPRDEGGSVAAALEAGSALEEGPAPSPAPPATPTPEAAGEGPDVFAGRRRAAYRAMDAAGITSDEGRREHVHGATKGRLSAVASLSEADLFAIIAAAEALDADPGPVE